MSLTSFVAGETNRRSRPVSACGEMAWSGYLLLAASLLLAVSVGKLPPAVTRPHQSKAAT